MAIVGNNLGQSFLAATKSANHSARPSKEQNAKPGTGSSSNSSDFETFLSQKESRAQKIGGDRPQDVPGRLPARLDGNDMEVRPMKSGEAVSAGNVEAKVEKRELDESVDNLAHRQALQQLLRRMKDEFDIDAEQIVEAFTQLSASELQQPPEASLDKIIQGLPLNPEQQVVAKAIFQDMLKQTAAQDMAGYLTASHRQLSLEVLSQKEAQKRSVNRAVEQMQSQFFGEQPKVGPSQTAGLSRYQNQKGETDGRAGVLAGMVAAAATTAAAGANATSSSGAAVQSTTSTQTGAIDWQQLGMEQVSDDGAMMAAPEPIQPQAKPTDAFMVAPKIINPTAAQAPQVNPVYSPQTATQPVVQGQEQAAWLNNFFKGENVVTQPQASAAPVATMALSAPAVAPSVPNLNLAALGMATSSNADAMSSGGEEEQGTDSTDIHQMLAPQNTKTGEQPTIMGKENFMINTQPTPNQEANNIRQVVSQAQLLARKGGGEMKIALAPEGLGKLSMKVAVENGQVNIEMIADSNEAKRLIEKGLGDLKATLMSHNLKVDQIRVDTPADVSRQLTQQHDDAQKQFAQQFMEQFRQENNEWRRGFFDIGSARAYNSQKEQTDRQPYTPSDSPRRGPSSRRLDLVA
ncbi:MAG: flagellar hook-length control protein FliK [Bdellovibrionales bacterium]